MTEAQTHLLHNFVIGNPDSLVRQAAAAALDELARRQDKLDVAVEEIGDLRNRLSAAERVQEGLRAERDRYERLWRLETGRAQAAESDAFSARYDLYLAKLISRADAEAIARQVFETWRQSPPFLEIPPFGERERFSHPTGQAFLDALSRAFQGSAEPPTEQASTPMVHTPIPEQSRNLFCPRCHAHDCQCLAPSVQSDPIPARQPTPRIESIHESVTMSMNHAGHLFAGDTCVNCGCSCASFNAAQMCGGKRPSFTSDSAVSASERPEWATLNQYYEKAIERLATLERDTLARARAAVQRVKMIDTTNDEWCQAVDECALALDALAASAPDHTQEPPAGEQKPEPCPACTGTGQPNEHNHPMPRR